MAVLRTDPWLSRHDERACATVSLNHIPQQVIFRANDEEVGDFCDYTKCTSDGANVIEASIVQTIRDSGSNVVRVGAYGVTRDTDVGPEDCTVMARPLKAPSMLIDVS